MKPINKDITIFLVGTTGDLAKKKILPSIFNLFAEDLLSDNFKLVGNSRTEMSDSEYQNFVKEQILPEDEQLWKKFCEKIFYVSGDVQDEQTFKKIGDLHGNLSACGNHIWYLATLPSLYPDIIRGLTSSKLNMTECGWTKILLEKPFGTDLKSAQELNQSLLNSFQENQIYRIDHFLAKETVQNILAFRFGNSIFEHHWNNNFVKEIQIQGLESIGVEGREKFYDQTGAVRDVIQNHILQMLAVIMMEEPLDFSSESIRHSRKELLAKFKIKETAGKLEVVFGQYTKGSVDGVEVEGYQQLKGVAAGSATETAAAMVCEVNNQRWQGVPIFIKAGKRLNKDVTEISVVFKVEPSPVFGSEIEKENILTFRIQPNEGVVVRLNVKEPGLRMKLDTAGMQFCYKSEFQMGLVAAYEKLIHDVVMSDTTLFPIAEGIESAWLAVQPVLDNPPAVEEYAAGSAGPTSFNQLLEKYNSSWIVPSVDVCQLPPQKGSL